MKVLAAAAVLIAGLALGAPEARAQSADSSGPAFRCGLSIDGRCAPAPGPGVPTYNLRPDTDSSSGAPPGPYAPSAGQAVQPGSDSTSVPRVCDYVETVSRCLPDGGRRLWTSACRWDESVIAQWVAPDATCPGCSPVTSTACSGTTAITTTTCQETGAVISQTSSPNAPECSPATPRPVCMALERVFLGRAITKLFDYVVCSDQTCSLERGNPSSYTAARCNTGLDFDRATACSDSERVRDCLRPSSPKNYFREGARPVFPKP